jgi:hypothetical protein
MGKLQSQQCLSLLQNDSRTGRHFEGEGRSLGRLVFGQMRWVMKKLTPILIVSRYK